LSKFEGDFKQQQSKMTIKIDIVLKVITDRIAGALPSDTVKNSKLNVNTTTLVLFARSSPTKDPQCSTHIHGSINAITICPKQQSDPHNDEPAKSEKDKKDSLENTNTNLSASPDPSVSFITKKIVKKDDDSREEEPEAGGLEEFVDELAHIISLPEYDRFYFRDLPDQGELMSALNSGIRENLSTTSVNLPIEDDYSPLLAYVVWIFVAYLTYPVIPPYLHPFGNEDTIFDPGITIY
nr:hypothetical protein [Tanacetum cinerariifolium]